MIGENETIRISKFLSLVLRHKPETIGLQLDVNGWADVDALIEKCNQSNPPLTVDTLKHIVATNSKNRFRFNEEENKIRANQGHSIKVELNLKSHEPPEVLYHGTAERNITSIFNEGLSKQQRQHVHLSADNDTAFKVDSRHGRPIVLEIMARQMFVDGYQFFLSDNGVWLTDNVPVKYLTNIYPNK